MPLLPPSQTDCPGWVHWGVGFFFVFLISFPSSAFKWMGKRRGKGSNYKAAYCDGMLLCLFLDFKGTSSGLNDHNLILPSFLANTWDYSNSEKPLFSVDSDEESRDLIQHKLVWKKGTHFRKPWHTWEPTCTKERYNNIKLWTYFGNLSLTAQVSKCCSYPMDESTSWKLSKPWQSYMQTTWLYQLCH